MPRGQPDFGAYAAKSVTAGLADMAELAARLGSIVTYDRRGEVIDFDDFEEPLLRWNETSLPLGGDGYFSALTTKSGTHSYYLVSAVGLNAVYNLYKTYQIFGSRRVGAEVSFCKLISSSALWLQIWLYTGSTLYKTGIKVSRADEKIYLLNNALGWTEVANTGIPTDAYFYFQTIKFVADFDEEAYVRLLYADNEYDISSYSIYSTASALTPGYLVYIQAVSEHASVAGAVWVDDFVLTQAEP